MVPFLKNGTQFRLEFVERRRIPGFVPLFAFFRSAENIIILLDCNLWGDHRFNALHKCFQVQVFVLVFGHCLFPCFFDRHFESLEVAEFGDESAFGFDVSTHNFFDFLFANDAHLRHPTAFAVRLQVYPQLQNGS